MAWIGRLLDIMNLTNVTKDLEHFFCYHCGSGFSGQHLSTPESYWMCVIAPWSLVILGHHFLDILWGGHLAEGYLFASLKVFKFDLHPKPWILLVWFQGESFCRLWLGQEPQQFSQSKAREHHVPWLFFFMMTRGQFKDSEKMRKLKILGTLWLMNQKSIFTVSEPIPELMTPSASCLRMLLSNIGLATSFADVKFHVTSLYHSLDCRHFWKFFCESVASEVQSPASWYPVGWGRFGYWLQKSGSRVQKLLGKSFEWELWVFNDSSPLENETASSTVTVMTSWIEALNKIWGKTW